jgi:hypothetical protein
MASALLLVGVLAACVLMLWLSYRIEPHWVSKDGTRLICYGQALSRGGQSSGRWRELRIARVRDDTVEVRTRRGSLAVDRPTGDPMRLTAGLMRRRNVRKATFWKVAGQTPTTTRNRVMYMLDGNNDASMPDMIAIRLPAKSKAIPMLDSLKVKRSETASRPNPETSISADQPDPD